MSLLLVALLGASPGALEVLTRLECHRCHEVEGLAPPPREKQCAGCHRELASAAADPARLAQGVARYGNAFHRFVSRTSTRLVDVPPLALGRFRASWLRAFLRRPVDLRPHLDDSMPALPLSEADLDALVDGLALQAERPLPPSSPAQLARGRALVEARCTACHVFTALPVRPTAPSRLVVRAPDLRVVRERLTFDTTVALLLDPRAVNPRAEMPSPGLTRSEAVSVAQFLFRAPLRATPAVAPVRAVSATVETVRYEDVETRVFRKTCWHCHSNADAADGDGGPGNTGGFGFAGAGLSFASWDEVMNGSIGQDGESRSIFRPGVSGAPVLLEVLRRRVLENRADHLQPGELPSSEPLPDDGLRGMPLGLPAITDDELALVERWIAAGTPRPSTPPGSTLAPTR